MTRATPASASLATTAATASSRRTLTSAAPTPARTPLPVWLVWPRDTHAPALQASKVCTYYAKFDSRPTVYYAHGCVKAP